MGRRLIWAVALVLAVGACSQEADDSTTTTPSTGSTTTAPSSSSTTTTPSSSSTTALDPPPIVTDLGRLAIVDASGNIVVMDPDGSNRQAITDRGENPVLYMQPVWSPDGTRLAWGQRTGSGFGIGIGRPGTDESRTLTTPDLPFYTYWSPDNRHLGALHNGDSGVQFQIVDTDAETTELLDEDAPFYFSWSPSGDRVVTHAGVSRTETITPDGHRVELAPTDGAFLAPQWTEIGMFHVVGGELVREDETGERAPIAAVSGLTMFVANPQGSHVALQTTGDGSPITASTEEYPTVLSDRVVVVDVDTGAIETVDDALALGFFWSPDGRSLLALTISQNGVVPKVWTLDGEERQFTPYQPSGPMLRDTFPFFPQYAQSVSFWAPDSSAFAFSGSVGDEGGIWVQPVDEETPTRVSDGVWVAWSPVP